MKQVQSVFYHNPHRILRRSMPSYMVNTPKVSLVDKLNPHFDVTYQPSLTFDEMCRQL